VKSVNFSEGDEVKVGQILITVQTEGGEAKSEQAAAPKAQKAEKPVREEAAETPDEKHEAEPEGEQQAEPAAAEKETRFKVSKEPAPAAPSVRRFAREIGININEVPGSGPAGRISIDDVKNHAKMLNRRKAVGQAAVGGFPAEPLPDFSKWGEVERQAMSKIREKTAQHLAYAWASIPHVTQHDKADMTQLEQFRKQYGKKAEAAGGKLTATAILLKITAFALKKFPQFNASIDLAKKEIIYKKYFNIGVAVDTPSGLLVPVVRDVDQKNIIQLSLELGEMAKRARERKLSLDDMQGGNFTISNLGGIGGTSFTPVVNSPEVAILGVSRGQTEPVYADGGFQPRMMLPLSLSYDHRSIDGADAARFLRWVAEAVEQPFLVLLEG
ncbi:MAG: 2-oxo acid dehydrogenase subunit E2, partial [Calditrichia bacterium]